MKLLLAVLASLAVFPIPISAERKIPSKTPFNETSCYWTHGRLSFNDGTPAFRLWKIGTHRVLGILSGPSANDALDNENPELPAEVRRVFRPLTTGSVFGDFEVCPLEPEKNGAMQSACIESAKNLVVEN